MACRRVDDADRSRASSFDWSESAVGSAGATIERDAEALKEVGDELWMNDLELSGVGMCFVRKR